MDKKAGRRIHSLTKANSSLCDAYEAIGHVISLWPEDETGVTEADLTKLRKALEAVNAVRMGVVGRLNKLIC